jgi:hypothetical protein
MTKRKPKPATGSIDAAVKRAALQLNGWYGCRCTGCTNMIESKLRKLLADVLADARRWRWINEHGDNRGELGDEIDAAIAEEGER